MSKTVVMFCNCIHEYQDMKHGNKRRVFNLTKKKNNEDTWRCTVCSKEVIGNIKEKDVTS
mgnify:CR=1 FL=1